LNLRQHSFDSSIATILQNFKLRNIVKIKSLSKLFCSSAFFAAASFASTAATAGPQPACSSLGFIVDIQGITDPSMKTATNVVNNDVAAGYCRHTNQHQGGSPGDQFKLTIVGQTPKTEMTVTNNSNRVLGSCLKWNSSTNLWSFEPLSGVAPNLCGTAQVAEPWCKDVAVGATSKCAVAFLYVQNYYAGTYQSSYHYTNPSNPAYTPMNIPHCSSGAPSIAPATQKIYGNHFGCFRKISGFTRTAAGDVFTAQLTQNGLGGTSPLKEIFNW
jgi:hypothetical protein